MEKSISVAKPRAPLTWGMWTLSAAWRSDMRHKLSLATMAAIAVFPLGSAMAQVAESGYSLPLALAMKAATKAIATCASNGYPVSAVVVDSSGVIKLEAKGDHSTILTATSAFRKAHTVVTFRADLSVRCFEHVRDLAAKNPSGAALATAAQHCAAPRWGRDQRSRTKSSLRSV